MTILGAVGIVAAPLQGGGPTATKGELVQRLTPAKRRVGARAEGPAVREKFLLFRVGDEIYGMGLLGLRQVLLSDGVTRLPAPPYQVCVALAYRGRTLPVIRMSALFEVPAAGASGTERVLLTQGRGRALGLLVDEVLEMAEVDPARITPLPALASLLDPACFRGVFTRQDRIILLVNEDGLGGFDEVVHFYAAGA